MEQEPQKTIQLRNEIFLEMVREDLKKGHTATFRVRGWSMRPFLENARDKVLLKPVPAEGVAVGDVALVQADDRRYVLHRVIGVDPDGGCTLWGDGNCRFYEHASASNIIGVAKGFFIGKKERYYDCQGRVWRAYSWFWMHVSPVRRLLLLLYRILYKLHLIEHAN